MAGATTCNGPYLDYNFNFFMRIFYDSNCYKASFIFGNFAGIKTGNAAYIMCKIFIYTLNNAVLIYLLPLYGQSHKNNKSRDLSSIQDE